MRRYKVLWIDDEPEKQDAFLDFAYLEKLDLHSFKTSKAGMEELKLNLEQYDAVILDGLAFDESEDEKADLAGLQNSINTIKSLRSRKVVPYFIFSAHLGEEKYLLVRQMLAKEKIFYKTIDNQGLIEAIKKEADDQEITQLKHKYGNVFEICSNKYIGIKHFDRILQVARDLENPEAIINQQDALPPMRKILEALFEKLNHLGVIPDDIQNNPGSINGASRFLSGKNSLYDYKENLINPVIAENIRYLTSFTQDAAHDKGSNLGADTYLSGSVSTFLYQSLCYVLFEVLNYMKTFMDTNNNKANNLKKWQLKSESKRPEVLPDINKIYKGSITKVTAINGWGTFESSELSETIGIPSYLMEQHTLQLGTKLNVKTKLSPCKTKLYIDKIII